MLDRLRHPLVLWTLATGALVLLGWKCPFFALTGHFCPGCGSVRAIEALTTGQLSEALQSNVLAITVLPIVLFGVVRPKSSIGSTMANHPRMVGLLAVLVAMTFTIARNTIAPWLAPIG